ncbi:MAG: universal stress protein [Desulfobacterales bacterium]|nr:MAG: universal stress protein [Desulfobacterales bacterium]
MQKMIVVTVDGSQNALKPLDFIDALFGRPPNLKIVLFHVLPGLPPAIVEESRKNPPIALDLQKIEKKNIAAAERLLAHAKSRLLQKGFAPAAVETVYRKRQIGIARDICSWSEDQRADAMVIATRGRGRLSAFFMGEIANKVLEFTRVCPVWMIKGTVQAPNVLVAVDNSENALRAVDHAGFMLAGLDAHVTVFHSRKDLRRLAPRALLDEFPELTKTWQHKTGEVVAPYLKKAEAMLLQAGLVENQVTVKVVDQGRSAADDILQEASRSAAGAIFLGKRGYSSVKDFAMGSVARKTLTQAKDMAICVVP